MHRFLGGVSLGYVSLAVVTLAGLWLTPFLLARVGTHDYGLWLITIQVLGYLTLLDFGVVALAPRETAYATGRTIAGGEAQLANLLGRFRSVIRWQVIPVVITCAVAWWLIAARWEELRWPLAAILALYSITFPFRLYQAALQGLQDLPFLAKLQMAGWAAGTIVTVALVLSRAGLLSLAAGWGVNQVILVTCCWIRLRRRFAFAFPRSDGSTTWSNVRDLFRSSSWVSLSQVSQLLLGGSDILMLGAILGPEAAVRYSCTAKLVFVLANHPQLLMQAAAPAMAEMRVSTSRDQLRTVTFALIRGTLILSGAVACLVIAVNEPFVRWWVGSEQFGGVRLTLLLVTAMLARHLTATWSYALFSFGYERRLSLTSLADGVVVLGVTGTLASLTNLGLASAPLGVLAGVMFVSLPVTGVALTRETAGRDGGLAVLIRGWALRLGAVASICLSVNYLVDVTTPARVVVFAVAVALLYAAVMWPLLKQPPLDTFMLRAIATINGWRSVPRPIPASVEPPS